MADPNPKRAKMDNRGTSSSTRPEELEIQPEEKLIKTGTQDFEVIRNMGGFVDHTHFIQSFLLKTQPKLAIFAPRRFGKSSHLDMVKMFLQIDADQITGEVPSSVNGAAKGRKNYKVFDGTRIITDDRHKNLVEDHLGKHPVIHLDFKVPSIGSVKEARKHCRTVVHKAYREHLYLKTSTKLEPNEEGNAVCQNICKRWCCDEEYKKQDLDGCLENLTRYLYNHFDGAKVYILVDEFDAVNAGALCEVRGNNVVDTAKELRKICNILAAILGPVTKGGHAHVAGALITGVSCVSGLGYSPVLNNFTVMRFLDGAKIRRRDNDFVPFYGATTEEVRSLVQKLVRNKELIDFEGKKEFLNETNELDADKIMRDVQSRYNGYFDANGTRIFCLWSVLQYLQSGKAMNYWNQTDGIDHLYKVLKCEEVASEIIKLMMGGDQFIEFERYDKIVIDELVQLHDIMQKEKVDKVNSAVVFNYLMDQGYLSYPEGGGTQGEKFKLPNAEIRAALSNMIRNIVENIWKISTTSCTSLINGISLSLMKDEKSLQNQMLDVYEAIPIILRPLEEMNRLFLNETTLLCVMYKAFNDAKLFELCVDLPIIKDAEGIIITLDRPDYLQLHKVDKKCSILWELKYKNENMNDRYTTSLHALQEARGIEATRSKKIKNYMNALEKLGRETLAIGLSIRSDLKVSISYSVGMDEKIFFMSETEGTLYPDLYETYKPVPLLQKENND